MERKQQQSEDMQRRVKELQHQVDELKEFINTLLSVIVEEPDGVHRVAPTIPGQGMMEVCMIILDDRKWIHSRHRSSEAGLSR